MTVGEAEGVFPVASSFRAGQSARLLSARDGVSRRMSRLWIEIHNAKLVFGSFSQSTPFFLPVCP